MESVRGAWQSVQGLDSGVKVILALIALYVVYIILS